MSVIRNTPTFSVHIAWSFWKPKINEKLQLFKNIFKNNKQTKTTFQVVPPPILRFIFAFPPPTPTPHPAHPPKPQPRWPLKIKNLKLTFHCLHIFTSNSSNAKKRPGGSLGILYTSYQLFKPKSTQNLENFNKKWKNDRFSKGKNTFFSTSLASTFSAIRAKTAMFSTSKELVSSAFQRF